MIVRYGESAHARKDNFSKQKKAPTVEKPKRKTIVSTKDSAKEAIKPLPRQLKCSHYWRLNHTEDNYFVFHLKKQPSSAWEKTLEAKIGALDKKFKNVAHLAKSWIHRLYPLQIITR